MVSFIIGGSGIGGAAICHLLGFKVVHTAWQGGGDAKLYRP